METACAYCSATVSVKPSRYKEGRNFCGLECKRQAHLPQPKLRNGETRLCAVCSEPFYASKSQANRRFCSHACHGVASRNPDKPCNQCGVMFHPPMGHPDRPYCSMKCAGIARRTRGALRPCKTCGKEFDGLKGNTLFCSHACSTEWQSRNKTKHSCKVCGNVFRCSPSRQVKNNITYCSLSCRDADPAWRERLLDMNRRQQTMKRSAAEVLGYALLDSLAVAYEPQAMIADKFCVDAFLPLHRLVIQFDGDYWHGNLDRFPVLDTRQARRAKLDKSQDAYMAKCGYRVFRIWHSRLQKDSEAVKCELLPLLTHA